MSRPFRLLVRYTLPLTRNIIATAFGALLFTPSAYSAFIQYNDEASFNTAISGLTATTADFESATAGDVISTGDTVEGITFTHSLVADFGLSMTVDNQFATTSPSNYLATNDVTPAFIGGDSFDMGFASAVLAIGLYVHTDSILVDGDITLTTDSGGTANLLVGTSADITLADGGEAYFIGLVTDMVTESFSSVSLSSFDPFPDGNFNFNVDDITRAVSGSDPGGPTPVDEPGALALLLLGLAGMHANRALRRRVNEKQA